MLNKLNKKVIFYSTPETKNDFGFIDVVEEELFSRWAHIEISSDSSFKLGNQNIRQISYKVTTRKIEDTSKITHLKFHDEIFQLDYINTINISNRLTEFLVKKTLK